MHCVINAVLAVYNTDFDECSETEDIPCHSNANCSNTFGSFSCECLAGYSGDGMTCKGE